MYCLFNCSYELRATFANEIRMEDGITKSDHLMENGARIYRFSLAEETKASRLVVVLDIEGIIKTSYTMFVARLESSDDVPRIDNSVGVIPTFFGQAGEIYSDSEAFCKGCEYGALVETKREGSFKITFKTDNEVHPINEESPYVRDIVTYGEHNCYTYNVNDQLKPLNIFLYVYSGDPDIFVNPLTLPKDIITDSKFKSKGLFNENLEISAEERDAAGAVTGLYYICIYGEIRSSYELVVLNSDQEQVLVGGLTKSMDVKLDQLITFTYDPKTDSKLVTLLFLSVESGKAAYLVKKCRSKMDDYGKDVEECGINSEEIKSPELYPDIIIEYSESGFLGDMGLISHDPSECPSGEHCYYLVGIIGESAESHFSLSVAEEAISERELREGQAYQGYLSLSGDMFFQFSVDDPAVVAVRIQLTSLSGDADLSVRALTGIYTPLDGSGGVDTLKTSARAGNIADVVEYSKRMGDEELMDVYHITVSAYTQTYFTLIYTLIRERDASQTSETSETNTSTNTTTSISSISLAEGIPQRFSLPKESSMLFAFRTNLGESGEEIRVELSEESGSFQMYISAGQIPTPDTYTWKGTSTRISSQDTHYQANAMYYVLMTREEGFWASIFGDSDSDSTFSIRYVTGEAAILLLPSQTQEGIVEKGGINYYKYIPGDLGSELDVSVTPFLGDPDLLISLDPSNQLPTTSEYSKQSSRMGEDSIRVTMKELEERNPLCSTSESGGLCAIYIGVYTRSENCTYSISVNSGEKKIVNELYEGQPQNAQVSHSGLVTFYFLPKHMRDYQITLTATTGNVKAYLNLIQNSNYEKDKWPIPTSEINDFDSSPRVKDEVIRVPREKTRACGDGCIYYIAVYQNPVADLERSFFSITTGSEVNVLREGIGVTDTVEKGEYTYHTFTVLCTNCTLTLSLTPLAGDAYLYVAKDPIKLPTTVADFNFFSASVSGEYLQIDSEDEYFRHSASKDMSGEYVIGVYGFKRCTYSLVGSTSYNRMHALTAGIPYMTQQQGGVQSYSFTQSGDSSFSIQLSMRSGQVEGIYVSVIADPHSIDLLGAIPTHQKYTWTSKDSFSTTSLTINPNYTNYIPNGFYIISVIPADTQPISYSILVDDQDHTQISFLSLGLPFETTLKKDASVVYGFIVQHQVDHHIYVKSILGGGASAYVSTVSTQPTQPTSTENTFQPDEDGTINLNADSPLFHTGQNYYLFLHAPAETQLYIIITMDEDLIWLKEGLSQYYHLRGEGSYAYFAYECPFVQGSTNQAVFEFSFTSKTTNFHPNIYITGGVDKDLKAYPDSKNYDEKYADWHKNSMQLNGVFRFNVTKSRLIVISVESNFGENVTDNNRDILCEFQITGWSSAPIVLLEETVISGTIIEQEGFNIYELRIPSRIQVEIAASPCLGTVNLYLSKSMGGVRANQYMEMESKLTKGYLSLTRELDQGVYYAVVQAKQMVPPLKDSWMQRKGIINVASYLIRMRLIQLGDDTVETYSLTRQGKLAYNHLFRTGEINLTFGSVLKEIDNKITPIRDGVYYEILDTMDKNINIDTLCGIVENKLQPIKSLKGKDFEGDEISTRLKLDTKGM